MPLFEVPQRATKANDTAIAKKLKSPARVSTAKLTLTNQITSITATVDKNLGKYRDEYIVIRDLTELQNYINQCIENKLISIDTETTGLDPIEDKLVGICIYTPNMKPAYIPINHVSYITGIRTDNQLTEEQVKPIFKQLEDDSIKVIMFNAKFDIRVLRNQIDVYLKAYWDGYLGARCLNENEEHTSLKKLHKKYVLKDKEDAFSYEEIFKGLSFDKIPIDYAYLYAAHDAIITYELYKFQEPYLSLEQEREDLRKVAWVFRNIEMACIDAVSNMEDTGVAFDLEYCNELSKKYNALLEERVKQFYSICDNFGEQLDAYREKMGVNNKLEYPINISSSSQIAITLYDILHIQSPDARNPRGTGDEILAKIDHPIANAIKEYREVKKLITTYIDKLPKCINSKDGRIHCKFNQYGADTGRMSSSDPNLQNIPSHNKDIRKMFTATDGYLLMSSDFSQQEPKALAALCAMHGDNQMLNTFLEGKDLYSEIASKAFNVPYDECKEFRPDGTTNKEGKARRTQAKSILLGVLYGRGTNSIAEQLKCSIDKAQQIKDSVFKGFPAIPKFEHDSLEMGEGLGYVTTVCGRKRRLPSLQLDEFDFKWKDGAAPDNDILDFEGEAITEVPEDIKQYYLAKLSKARFSQKKYVIEEAASEGIKITDNGGKIADAHRQCVNARIQGSAADLTKIAMIHLNENEELRKLGFRMLIPVHDEVIAECPKENIKECSRLLAETMSKAAEEILNMPIKCDVAVTKQWYGEEITV